MLPKDHKHTHTGKTWDWPQIDYKDIKNTPEESTASGSTWVTVKPSDWDYALVSAALDAWETRIMVYNWTYAETVDWNITDEWTIIHAHESANVVVNFSGTWIWVYLDADKIEIKWFEFSITNWYVFEFSSNSIEYWRIIHNTITDIDASAWLCNHWKNMYFAYNDITQTANYAWGIFDWDCENAVIEWNVFKATTHTGSWNLFDSADDTVIIWNSFIATNTLTIAFPWRSSWYWNYVSVTMCWVGNACRLYWNRILGNAWTQWTSESFISLLTNSVCIWNVFVWNSSSRSILYCDWQGFVFNWNHLDNFWNSTRNAIIFTSSADYWVVNWNFFDDSWEFTINSWCAELVVVWNSWHYLWYTDNWTGTVYTGNSF